MDSDKSYRLSSNRSQSRSQRLTRVGWRGSLGSLLLAAAVSGLSCPSNVPTPGGSTPGATNDANLAFRRPVILPDDHVLGDAAATLVVVQYEEYQSQDCGKFARDDFAAFRTQYIDAGKVRWVFRQFPQSGDTRAQPAATAAECANDQGHFFDYRDLVYATVDSSNKTILTDAQLQANAATLGLDTVEFNACFAGDSKDARVQQDVDTATALGLTTVPTFVVGTETVSNPTTPDQLTKIIDRHLANQ